MRDLSLHVLDVIENAIRAGASTISVVLTEDLDRDLLEIVVEDNGPGLRVSAEVATDPFYTTKSDKPTGLGLSLFRAAAERAGGSFTVGASELGGVAVRASMQFSHVDRSPLGDLAATCSAVACTDPRIDLRVQLRVGRRKREVRVSDVIRELPVGQRGGLGVARRMGEKLKAGMQAIAVMT